MPWFEAWTVVCKMHPSLVGGQEGIEFPILFIAMLAQGNQGLVAEQWTGLVDRNGVEIYEGDLISMWPHKRVDDPTAWHKTGVVEWNPETLGYSVEGQAANSDFGVTSTSVRASDWVYTVLGNLHQHPHLLSPST